jgi:hypothetical protein
MLGSGLDRVTPYIRDQVRRCCRRSCLNADISLRSLIQSSPDASLGILVAVDGQIFQTDVYSASHSLTQPRLRKLSRWGDRAVVLIGIRLGIAGVNLIYYETIRCVIHSTFFHTRSIDVNEGAVHIPTVSWDSGRPFDIFIILCWVDNRFYLDSHHTQATIPPRPLTQTMSVSVGSRLGQKRPRGDLCLHAAIIFRQHRMRPVARAHRPFRIRLPHQRPYQNNYRRQVHPLEAHTFVRTLLVRMEAGR